MTMKWIKITEENKPSANTKIAFLTNNIRFPDNTYFGIRSDVNDNYYSNGQMFEHDMVTHYFYVEYINTETKSLAKKAILAIEDHVKNIDTETKQLAKNIILELDKYGRDKNSVEYGLPIDPDTKDFEDKRPKEMLKIVERIIFTKQNKLLIDFARFIQKHKNKGLEYNSVEREVCDYRYHCEKLSRLNWEDYDKKNEDKLKEPANEVINKINTKEIEKLWKIKLQVNKNKLASKTFTYEPTKKDIQNFVDSMENFWGEVVVEVLWNVK